MSFDDQIAAMLLQIDAAFGIETLRAMHDATGQLEPTLIEAILGEAGRFADDQLTKFDREADRVGCRLENGRVITAPGHETTWAAFREGGWTGLDIGAEHGGQGLPTIVAVAVQELMDRGSISFGMLPGSGRAAARLLHSHASPEIADSWIPKLASGEWGATICISEPDAGSDVGRIRCAARRDATGSWRVSGEKIWISFGDHALTERIGHVVLARPEGSSFGTRGLSLFLVPTSFPQPDGSIRRNGVAVRRLEEKLGLHGSPTCALGFEDAEAVLIGTEGRGLPQLFRMITAMRLQVGTQALGLASASYAAASLYAQERRQGGPADAPAVPISTHADVQLMLAGIASRIETLRGLVYAAAVAADLAEAAPELDARAAASSLLGWLLPIVKNSGAETAFEAAAEATLVFGGAGYTTEWPVERYLRDARILAIYEGTTGMQALDLVRRRWRVPETGFEAFAAAVTADLATFPEHLAAPLRTAMSVLRKATEWLRDPARTDGAIDAAARAALRLATEVSHGWIAARLAARGGATPAAIRLAACGRHGLLTLEERTLPALTAIVQGQQRVDVYSALIN